jgi:hypothetical protein
MGSLEVGARDVVIANCESDDHAQMLCNYSLAVTLVKMPSPKTPILSPRCP